MDTHGVTVRSMRVLRGPNLYAYMPVFHVVLDIGPYEEQPSTAFPGFVERITAWLPGPHKHECGLGRPGGFVERLRSGTYLGHIVEHITLELQNLMGFDVAFGRARGAGETGVYHVVFAYKEEQPARVAFETALRLTLAAMHDEPFDIQTELEQLLLLADKYRLGPSTAAIVAAARARDIPVLRLTPTGSLVQLGYGVYQKRIRASETSLTSSIAVDLCQEKSLTNRMLRAVGVPVPEGRTVTSAKEAWEAAQAIGMPVVVKPETGNQGKGVSVNLTTEEQVRAAYQISRTYGPQALVERSITGDDYRLLVVAGELVAAARREPAQVVGDGQQTIEQLVELVNQDSRRRPGHSSILTRIAIDDAVRLVLAQQGLAPDSVPEAGQFVKLRTNCNLSTGGTAIDVTDVVHPRNARIARLAAQILGLDVAGIDMLCGDIGRPLSEQDGAIVEVNAAPGLRMHLHPSEGQPRDVATSIVEMFYPQGAPARIPIIAVTGTNGKTTVTRLIAHMYQTAHWVVGMTCTQGTYIAGERIMAGDCSGPQSARAVLLHPRVEVAVLETARGGILREGLAFDRCSVGVVTNISSDHLGIGGVETLEALARVKQVVIESVRKQGVAVLNAEDRLVAEMAAATDAEVVYFGRDSQQHVLAAHVAAGGRGVFVANGVIILAQNQTHVDLIELERVGFTQSGAIAFQVENALAAAAAAWAAGLNPALIARALTTIQSDTQMAPGRFNVWTTGTTPRRWPRWARPSRRWANAGRSCCWRCRAIVATQIWSRRSRRPGRLWTSMCSTSCATGAGARGEVLRLLRSRLPEQARSVTARDQAEALRKGWKRVGPGERLVLVIDEVEEALKLMQGLLESSTKDAICEAPLESERAVGR